MSKSFSPPLTITMNANSLATATADIDTSKCDLVMVSIIRHGLSEKPQRLQDHMMIPKDENEDKDTTGTALFYPSPTLHSEAPFPVRSWQICTVIFANNHDYQKYAARLSAVGVHSSGAEDGSCVLPLECTPYTESSRNTVSQALAAVLGMDPIQLLPPPEIIGVHFGRAATKAGCNNTQ
jgi:hypothetical protein